MKAGKVKTSTAARPPRPPRPRGPGRPPLATRSQRATSRAALLAATDQVPVTDFLSVRDYLQKLYDHLKQTQTGYSYAQLGEDLGLSRTNVLWLVITGRRRLTAKACAKVAAALGLTGDARRYLETLSDYTNARRSDVREELFRELTALKGAAVTGEGAKRHLEYFSEWHHPVIRELAGLEDFRSDPDWINGRLVVKLTPLQIQRSLELLERMELIAYDRKKGRHVQTGGQIMPARDVERLAAVRFHQRMCDMAREAVTRVAAERREMNTLTLCVTDETAMKAAEILYKACEQIMRLEQEAKEKDQVYQINVHLFPFTKRAG